MKISILALISLVLVSALAGAAIARAFILVENNQRVSFAGQTLADLSLALESSKILTGEYPDSIEDLEVTHSKGDSSPEIFKSILYFKTEKGFVAFAGLPNVAFIYPGTSSQYQ